MTHPIIDLVTRAIEGQGFEVVQVKSDPGKRVRAWVDREPDGPTVDDCVSLSRAVRDAFDLAGRDPGEYLIEIQSPGLDRVLTRDKDFVRFAGQQVNVKLKEKRLARKNFKGKLVGRLEGEVVIEGDETWRFGPDEVAEVRLVPALPSPRRSESGRTRKPRKSRRKRPKAH